MKTKYEYVVKGIAAEGYPVQAFVENRREAREMKNRLKGYECTNVKIVQNVYKLETSKEVR